MRSKVLPLTPFRSRRREHSSSVEFVYNYIFPDLVIAVFAVGFCNTPRGVYLYILCVLVKAAQTDFLFFRVSSAESGSAKSFDKGGAAFVTQSGLRGKCGKPGHSVNLGGASLIHGEFGRRCG